MVKPKTIKRKQTKKQKNKIKNANRKTKKKHQKQKGGSIDALNMIVRDEPLESLKSYVEQGGDVNQKGSLGVTGLMEAVAIQDKEKTQYLLDKGADVNAVAENGMTAYSLSFGNDTIVNILKDAGANTDPTYLLMLAIENNNIKSAKQ